ncbi:thermonuclease family protein [Nitratidesulfovibrio sp. 1201_IL3209]|uniref:thermonuclease family protein n=1 Tax=Nitratidesulfovibrio sp. 1201_IL3209 TaxID=3084053 RepID=UPI002FD9AC9A
MLVRPRALLGLLLVLVVWTLAGLEPWQGRVVAVPDGDTIVVRDGQDNDVRVRLYGIDAPELHQRGGEQARSVLMRMVMGRTVYLVTIDRDAYDRDVAHVRTSPFPWSKGDTGRATDAGKAAGDAASSSGGRSRLNAAGNRSDATLPPELAPTATSSISNDVSNDVSNDINGDMLRAGQAWFYGEYCRLPYPCLSWYLTASKARETNIGLWKTRNPTPPWEWRRKNR